MGIVPQNKLSQIGLVCEKYILNINTVYEIVRVDNYVIMPNHIHLLLSIHGTMWASSPTINVETIIRSFKTLVTKETGRKIFQRSFHDHIIRGEEDYIKIAEYIYQPLKMGIGLLLRKNTAVILPCFLHIIFIRLLKICPLQAGGNEAKGLQNMR